MTTNFKLTGCIFSLALTLGLTSPAIAQDTVLPDFQGEQREFSNYRTRITDAMLEGPNFARHYSLITIGCGTSCKFGYVGDHRTGKLFYFPFGGEEHYDMQLDFSSTSDQVILSFQDNSMVETDNGWKPIYEPGDSPCSAVSLIYRNEQFTETQRRSVARYNRRCPSGPQLFTLNAAGSSEFEDACFSDLTRFDLCQHAKETASEADAYFPIQINGDMSLRSLRNEGPSLALTAVWELSQSEIEARLSLNGMSSEEMRDMLKTVGAQNACGTEILSAFLRLGGALNYRYLDSGYRTLHDFSVRSEDCGQSL